MSRTPRSYLKLINVCFKTRSNILCASRSNFSPKYRFERCQKVKGICKTFCDDVEYDYGYCIKWRNQCCI
ncbi:beta-defensin 110-like [Lepus europaeus]|uniref:beta-defensin 110-like n=1 Tax=Lepus europaeus TaxID=9983 RepID=UPI002B46ED99|nr:beta-defensin 110-like [Lepus europaeus]